MQQTLRNFESNRKQRRTAYVFDYGDFYRYLVSGKNPVESKSPEVVSEFESLEIDAFSTWSHNLLNNERDIVKGRPALKPVIDTLRNKPLLKNLTQLREFLRQHPLVNDLAGIGYQSGVGGETEMRSGYLHFNTARLTGYRKELPTADTRVYLNPPTQVCAKIAKLLLKTAADSDIPMKFKIIDFSLDSLTPEDRTRVDRFVIYVDRNNLPRLVRALQGIREQYPDWFKSRPLPKLVAQNGEGIGIAHEPTPFQKNRYGERGQSFSSIRALFLKDVWLNAVGDILKEHPEFRPRGRRTLREIFDAHLHGVTGAEVAAISEQKVNEALLRLMADVVPNLTAQSLLRYVQRQIEQKAEAYGINPENLALNK